VVVGGGGVVIVMERDGWGFERRETINGLILLLLKHFFKSSHPSVVI
jgi:hypothetical protein